MSRLPDDKYGLRVSDPTYDTRKAIERAKAIAARIPKDPDEAFLWLFRNDPRLPEIKAKMEADKIIKKKFPPFKRSPRVLQKAED